MKSWALIMAALAVTSASSAGPAISDDLGAKGLYFEQLDRPSDSLNTGIQYWIELNHNGRTTRANNKTVFHAGDKIRFHVKPNVDGYAYIVLRSGSQGEEAVLFPDPERKDVNQIKRGQEMTLPQTGMFKFDENPGTEKIRLVISRKPIDPSTLLSPQNEEPTRVAMSISGSKDLIPNRVFVAYNNVPSNPLPPPPAATVTRTTTSTTTVQTTKPVPVKKVSKPPVRIASAPTQKTKVRPSRQGVDDASVVTIVYNDPAGVLTADISLQHE